MSKNYYAILGVPQNATARQVRQRFLTLARERHPDKFQGPEKEVAEVEFQQVTEAFNHLNDGERRRQHDLELAQPVGATETDQEQLSRVYVHRGKEAAKEGNQQQAVEYIDRATREDPRNHAAWYQLAKVLEADRRALPRARIAIAKACEIQPMEPKYLRLAGDLFAGSGMADKALGYYQKALDWGGSDPRIEEKIREITQGPRGGLFGR